MTTHRSLNKLEFKAHMSIHNFTEVREGEGHESRNFTRDRFGKQHALSDEQDTPRLRTRRSSKVTVLAAVLLTASTAAWSSSEGHETAGRGTNITVESADADEVWLRKKLNPDDGKFGLALDENKSVGFNEDGDPSLNMRF